MNVAYFLEVGGSAVPAAAILETLGSLLGDLPEVVRSDVFTPLPSQDPFLDDAPGPGLALQIRFAEQRPMAEALASSAFARLRRQCRKLGTSLLQEALILENYPLAGPVDNSFGDVVYRVNYHRPAADEAAFLDHYRSRHPPIMLRLPGLRHLELGLPIDWTPVAGIARADRLLFCEVGFDDLTALNAALASAVRRELRRDFATFPLFNGAVTHCAMRRH